MAVGSKNIESNKTFLFVNVISLKTSDGRISSSRKSHLVKNQK